MNDSERMGYMAYLSTETLGMFNRQEGRLERSFYRTLHDLQRLRKGGTGGFACRSVFL